MKADGSLDLNGGLMHLGSLKARKAVPQDALVPDGWIDWLDSLTYHGRLVARGTLHTGGRLFRFDALYQTDGLRRRLAQRVRGNES